MARPRNSRPLIGLSYKDDYIGRFKNRITKGQIIKLNELASELCSTPLELLASINCKATDITTLSSYEAFYFIAELDMRARAKR